MTITDPGKFEGEPEYVPFFWSLYLDGGADDDDGDKIGFDLNEDDWLSWPELKGCNHLVLWVDDNGFVNSELW